MRRALVISAVRQPSRRFQSESPPAFYAKHDESYYSVEKVMTNESGKMICLIAAPQTAMPEYWDAVQQRISGMDGIVLGEIHMYTQASINIKSNRKLGITPYATYMIPDFVTSLEGSIPVHMIQGEYGKGGLFSTYRKSTSESGKFISNQVEEIMNTHQYSRIALLHDCTSLKVVYKSLLDSGYSEFLSNSMLFCPPVTSSSEPLHKAIALLARNSIKNKTVSPYFYVKIVRVILTLLSISVMVYWYRKNSGGGSPPSPTLHTPPAWQPMIPYQPPAAAQVAAAPIHEMRQM